jgi:hypothetical protein
MKFYAIGGSPSESQDLNNEGISSFLSKYPFVISDKGCFYFSPKKGVPSKFYCKKADLQNFLLHSPESLGHLFSKNVRLRDMVLSEYLKEMIFGKQSPS